jgi:hypothetical protein
MISIHHCNNCEKDFLIPLEISDGLDITIFVCPECKSHNWITIAG